MKTRLLVAAALLGISLGAQAMPTKPAKCPSVDAIRSVGLSEDIIEQDEKGQWLVVLVKSNYDTVNSWTFIVGQIDASDKTDAYKKATDSLNTLTLNQGPIAIEQISRWGCLYSNASEYIAISITPDLEGGMFKSAVRSFS